MNDNMALALDIIDYSQDVDPYAITTSIDDVNKAARDLATNLDQCMTWLEEQAEEYDDDRARNLIDRIMAANYNDDENRGDTTMTTTQVIDAITEAFETSTHSDNAFKRTIDGIDWDDRFDADGEHYFTRSDLIFTTPALDPFEVTRDWPAEFTQGTTQRDVFGNMREFIAPNVR